MVLPIPDRSEYFEVNQVRSPRLNGIDLLDIVFVIDHPTRRDGVPPFL